MDKPLKIKSCVEKELQMLLITQTLARVKASIRLNGSENAAWILKHL